MATSNNGKAFIVGDKAKGYANYPHMRQAGNFLFVSGISSRRPDNTHRGAEQHDDGNGDVKLTGCGLFTDGVGTWSLDIREQTRGIIENIRSILSEANCDLTHVVDVTVFLTDMEHYKGMNEVYNEFFDCMSGPTRTCVAVKQLPHPNLLVEIKAMAMV
eukprot:CFRG2866T1